ncbi:MAG: FliI/YscN family ATPase [Planctomycetes bacterium]|nr:FliI/YscN family ATPase [Planctomycetota bacterium]
MTALVPPDVLARALRLDRAIAEGLVRRVAGIALEVAGLRSGVGDVCAIDTGAAPLWAEIVGFGRDAAIAMPYGPLHGVRPGARVIAGGEPLGVPCSEALLGRVIDPLGRPLDGGPPLAAPRIALVADAPGPLERRPITEPFETGVSAIDALLTLGRGQRVGVFAGSGVGKSTLLGTLARCGRADVNVIVLVGERGREVGEFLTDVLGADGLRRSVVVVATGDAAPMLRRACAFAGIAVAEWFRDRGADVLLTMDSITRFAGAVREIGLAAGEPAALRGYPPSLFAELPRLVERLGSAARGSITAVLTVLVEGDDLAEPVSDALRGHLDGHIVLDRAIAARGRYPAIDLLQSLSRLMPKLVDGEHLAAATAVRRALAVLEDARDLVQVGAYRAGSDPELDAALAARPALDALLAQGAAGRDLAETGRRLADAVGAIRARGFTGPA